MPEHRTESLRAFQRVLRIDPTYTLAYEHQMDMLTWASYDRPVAYLALVARIRSPCPGAGWPDPAGQPWAWAGR